MTRARFGGRHEPRHHPRRRETTPPGFISWSLPVVMTAAPASDVVPRHRHPAREPECQVEQVGGSQHLHHELDARCRGDHRRSPRRLAMTTSSEIPIEVPITCGTVRRNPILAPQARSTRSGWGHPSSTATHVTSATTWSTPNVATSTGHRTPMAPPRPRTSASRTRPPSASASARGNRRLPGSPRRSTPRFVRHALSEAHPCMTGPCSSSMTETSGRDDLDLVRTRCRRPPHHPASSAPGARRAAGVGGRVPQAGAVRGNRGARHPLDRSRRRCTRHR